MDGVLSQAFIYLCAAVVAVPIANRLGLGSVLGYLIAGIVIGPALGFVGVETANLQEFAQFGVVMMLFLVGLELEPRMLWDMRRRLVGLGGLQVVVTGLVLAGFVMLLGQTWRVGVATGAILALSSTAIVIQTLTERGLMKTDGGRASFSILLFQDIAVIPMLALMPLLMDPFAAGPGPGAVGGHGGGALATAPGWTKALLTLGAVGVVVVAGRFAVRPGLRIIASTRLREMFTASALLLIVAIAWLMSLVGLSPALGTFLAGVVLADSEFRHELESDIEPFKGLLMGLFFITVGAATNFKVLIDHPVLILALTAGLIALKVAALYPIAKLFKIPACERWLVALSLAQGGEFAFVLLGFATAASVFAGGWAKILSIVVTLSMLVTPALFILYTNVIQPRFARSNKREADVIDEKGVAIIAGLGRFGQIVHRMLKASGFSTVVIDVSSTQIDTLRTFGIKGYYGDASRPEMLHAAGIDEAKVLVVAIDDQDKAEEIVRHVHTEYPHVRIIARAFDRVHYYKLRDAGADDVIRELFNGSLEAAKATLLALGVDAAQATRMQKSFRKHDEDNLIKLYDDYRHEPDVLKNQDYINRTKAAMDTLTEVLARDAGEPAARD
jgi:monovalent cation:proton antiporter-2 (CPA2) family protein